MLFSLIFFLLLIITICTVVMIKNLKEDFIIKMGDDTTFRIELIKRLILIGLCIALGVFLYIFFISRPEAAFLLMTLSSLLSIGAVVRLILALAARKKYKKNPKYYDSIRHRIK